MYISRWKFKNITSANYIFNGADYGISVYEIIPLIYDPILYRKYEYMYVNDRRLSVAGANRCKVHSGFLAVIESWILRQTYRPLLKMLPMLSGEDFHSRPRIMMYII